jgi:iron complex outermembrane recepter protein
MNRSIASSTIALIPSLLSICQVAQAQTENASKAATETLPAVVVNASADASAAGLTAPYAGGQVARGGRAGILGTKDNMSTPFSITSYTNLLIQETQARSVGDVLQNDPTIQIARGFGNFQESYFMRGFIVSSDDVAYNGLYSILPRQYIAAQLIERLEVLRGASTFLVGASPNGGGSGGTISVLPKRAPNQALNEASFSYGSGGQALVAVDIARRFGTGTASGSNAASSTGFRVNAAVRNGGTSIDNEKNKLGLLSIGLDWRSSSARLSADLGYQDNQLNQTRTNVSLGFGITSLPTPPKPATNFAQPWSYSNERDVFGTLRGEFDFSNQTTAWIAVGTRSSDEANSLANLDVSNATTGAGSTSRFDNSRNDQVLTGEVGLKGKFRIGAVGHEWVVSASSFKQERNNAYAWDYFNTQATNLYSPIASPQLAFSSGAFVGNSLRAPALTNRVRLSSIAVGDTISLLNDQWLVTIGLRAQRFDITNFAYNSGAQSDRYTKSKTSPMFALVYKPNMHWSLYGNYMEALAQGETASAFLNPPPTNAGAALAPYVSKQKEIGAKYDGGRLGVTASYFNASAPRALVNASNVFAAEGSDKHQGVELTFFGMAGPDLKLLGGATVLDAKQIKTGSSTTEGKRVLGSPRLQANIGLQWIVRTLPGLSLDARLVHSGNRFADSANGIAFPGWTRADVGAKFKLNIGNTPINLLARIDNVANRRYWSSVGGYPGIGYLVAGSPRTISVSGSFEF